MAKVTFLHGPLDGTTLTLLGVPSDTHWLETTDSGHWYEATNVILNDARVFRHVGKQRPPTAEHTGTVKSARPPAGTTDRRREKQRLWIWTWVAYLAGWVFGYATGIFG
jgi:hypothetical protein